jgi:hypothetical protein
MASISPINVTATAKDGADGERALSNLFRGKRRGNIEPQLIAKQQRQFPSFEKRSARFTRAAWTCGVQGHLGELYDIETSPHWIQTWPMPEEIPCAALLLLENVDSMTRLAAIAEYTIWTDATLNCIGYANDSDDKAGQRGG